ncbi:MAG TPA: protein kinase, partial [Polyangiaceae bacterium]|nr:protein kinase [Polyangiaceae bacterium]
MVDQGTGDDEQDFPSTLPGTIIAGKYRLDGMIGRGGMGSVWSTMHLGLGQRVAVKLIAKRYAGSREARQRFDLEAKAVAQLRSRYVVQIFDNGETEDGTPYIVMELLDGESLDHRIERRGPVPLDQAVRIIGQVGRALMRAHGLGIVHRDLKPENIFLTRNDEDDAGEIAKVLDFGIAKIKTADTSSSATRTGTVLGTPLFMSPEQARGLKSVDHRTDLYSLGMVAFTMLTGRNAYSGESFGDILVAICTQPLPSLRTYAALLPPSLDAWMQRACAKEPGDRFAAVEPMIEALHAAAGMARPKLQGADRHAPNQPSQIRAPNERSGSSGTGVPATHIMTQASGGLADERSSAGLSDQRAPAGLSDQRSSAGFSDQHTTAAVSVSGADIPTRSMAMPAVLIGLAALLLGGVGAFVVLREPAGPSQASKGEGGAPTLVNSVPAPTATQSTPHVVPPAPKSSAAEPAKPSDPSAATTPKTAIPKPPPAASPPPAPPPPAAPPPAKA